LTPAQTETLAVSRQRGTLSLALRSLADSKGNAVPVEEERRIVTVYRGVEPETLSCDKQCDRR
jgi:pilus assembly protein CpaB